MRRLSELLDIHRDFERIFEVHQRHLLRFRFAEALDALREYDAALRKHVADEESLLLPIYIERGEIRRGGAAQMFFDEHEKLINHVVLFRDELEKFSPDDSDIDRKVIWLLEREGFFKKLHDHHDIRETDFLYPELDRITTDDEKVALLAQVTLKF